MAHRLRYTGWICIKHDATAEHLISVCVVPNPVFFSEYSQHTAVERRAFIRVHVYAFTKLHNDDDDCQFI